MLEGLSEKFKKVKKPEESLLKKIEKIKKTSETDSLDGNSSHLITDRISEQLKKTEEEIYNRIEETINSKSEQIDANSQSIKEADDKLSRIESAVSASKLQTDDLKERLDKIDENLLELLSLYEVVSNTVNPFIGENDSKTSEKFEELEKKINAISQTAPDLFPDIKEEYDIKFTALENSLEALTEVVEANKFDQEALIDKISEQVLKNIKPLIEKTLQAQNDRGPSGENHDRSTDAPESQYSRNGNSAKLARLNNKAETSIILLNWLEFLMEKVGRNNLQEVLEYYIEISWISEEVCKKMMTFANGIDYYVERPTWKLLPEDHTKSLMFIEQLTGGKIDKHMLSKLERDVEKVIKPEVYTF